jgi:hypothetical protein
MSLLTPQTCTCGPKGIRTPDLLAASQTGPYGVRLTKIAGHTLAEWRMLFAELHQPTAG